MNEQRCQSLARIFREPLPALALTASKQIRAIGSPLSRLRVVFKRFAARSLRLFAPRNSTVMPLSVNIKRRFAQTFLIISFALCLSACVAPPGNPFTYGSAVTEPKKDEIGGVWAADEAALKRMRQRDKYNGVSPKFVFAADGSFTTENMPDSWIEPYGEERSDFKTYSGTWKLLKADHWVIGLSCEVPNAFTVIDLLEHRFNGQPRFLFIIYIGDPDSGEALIFVKQ